MPTEFDTCLHSSCNNRVLDTAPVRAVVQRVTSAAVTVEGEVVRRFGAAMHVESVNDGPFTVLVEV